MRKVIIVGATSGIGRQLAYHYVRQGWLVGITGRREELLRELFDQYPEQIRYIAMDVCMEDSAPAQLQTLIDVMGGMDVFIYNAGVGLYNPTFELAPDITTIHINLIGFVRLTHLAYHYFSQRGKGHIVGISSIASVRGNARAIAYSASKAFMSNYLEGLWCRTRQRHQAIKVTDIQPGYVDTPMTTQNKGMFWVATPQKAAAQIYRAVESGAKVAYITRRWRWVAYALRWVPGRLIARF